MLRRLDPREAKEHWPFVEAGLKRIIKKCPGTTWTPETVYWRVVRDQAALFCCEDGFFVAERCIEPHTEAWYLNVWCMYFLPGKAKGRMQELMQQIDLLQEHFLCKFTQFSSPRLGWGRAMSDYFKLHLCIFRREK